VVMLRRPIRAFSTANQPSYVQSKNPNYKNSASTTATVQSLVARFYTGPYRSTAGWRWKRKRDSRHPPNSLPSARGSQPHEHQVPASEIDPRDRIHVDPASFAFALGAAALALSSQGTYA